MGISSPISASKIAEIALYTATNIAFVIPSVDIGINGFLFDTIGEESLNLESDITDYWVEDGTPAQDNIALKPVVYRLRGNIAEIKMQPQEVFEVNPEIKERLQDIEAFKPSLNQQAQNFISGQAARIVKPIETSSLFKKIKDLGIIDLTKQKAVFFYFQILQENRVLSVVQTPWRILPNMAIQSIVANQGEDSQEITEFDIIFKQINYIKSDILDLTSKSGRASPLSSAVKNNGITPGIE